MSFAPEELIYAIAGVAVFGLALRAVFMRRHLLAKIIAANIAASGVFLFLVGVSGRGVAAAADPVAQALVLTGIVISVSITAYALALLRRLYDESGSAILPEDQD